MITVLYAGILGLIFIGLTLYVVMGRFKHRVGLGDGGNPDLIKRIRIHGNFSESVPLALLLLFMVDTTRFEPMIVHTLGIALVVGRILHIFGICSSEGASWMRASGVILTLTVILVSALLLIWHFLALRAAGF